jgi:Lon protease-like protein
MQSKSLLIAIAAFAVTATGVQAFQSTQLLQKAGLSEAQIEAFEIARELRESGDFEGARDTLIEAGVDEAVIKSVKDVAREYRQAIRTAIEEEDYEAFTLAVAGTPLAEAVDTEADFQKFVEAHTLKEEGKWNEAKVILDELGVEPKDRMPGMGHGQHGMRDGRASYLDDLTGGQQEALEVARKANDKEAVQAILQEAGIEVQLRHYF